MKFCIASMWNSSLAPAVLTLALILGGCASEAEDSPNNTADHGQTCTGKCDSPNSESGLRPLATLTIVDDGSSVQDDGSADAGVSDAGDSDAGDEFADAGSLDAGSSDAGSSDAGSFDAGSSDAGSFDVGSEADAGSADAADGSTEADDASFRLVGTVADSHLDQVDDAQVLTAKIWATTAETTSDEPLVAELTYDTDEDSFASGPIDAGQLPAWDILTIRVAGEFGEESFEQTFEFAFGESEGTEILPEPDPFAAARDVEASIITIDPELAAPDYHYPSTDAPFGLSGTEFWQKWPGGHSPTYSYSEGTEAGRKCMTASAMRFEAIMDDPPEALIELVDESDWGGRFFNWNDDFSHEDSTDWANGAALWAWRTHLIKWISQTGDDGRCYLPTRDLVERAAANCLQTARSDDGEIQGCQAN